jgi:hypothetical protein
LVFYFHQLTYRPHPQSKPQKPQFWNLLALTELLWLPRPSV